LFERIDQRLCSSVTAITDVRIGKFEDATYQSSDHRPVFIELNWPEKPEHQNNRQST
jgi:predicted extracellular nuclease